MQVGRRLCACLRASARLPDHEFNRQERIQLRLAGLQEPKKLGRGLKTSLFNRRTHRGQRRIQVPDRAAHLVRLGIQNDLSAQHIGEWIADIVGLGWLFLITWNIAQWPVAVTLMLLALAIIYYVCPDVKQDWRWVTPGSVCAGSIWLLVSLAFKAYVEHFGNYNAAYGSIAGVIVLMLWLYLTGVVILLGGEINAQIQQAASSLRIRQEKAPQTVPAPAN